MFMLGYIRQAADNFQLYSEGGTFLGLYSRRRDAVRGARRRGLNIYG